jgi:predicted permease
VRHAQHADTGFQPEHVLLTSLDLFPAGYTPETGMAFERELVQRIERIPGVRSATFSDWTPLGFRYNNETIVPDGYVPRKNESFDMMTMKVGPRYLETMGIPLAEGRDIRATDAPKTERVAIVNQTFAKRYWPGQEALGRRVNFYGTEYSVVGVARDSKYNQLDEAPKPFVFRSALQNYRASIALEIRVAGDPKAYAAPVAAAIHSLNADLPVLDQFPLTRNVELASTNTRIAGTFVGMFGLVGLALAAIGIYGVVAYTTRQRTHEIGIRVALGAKRRDVFELVLKQGLLLTGLGMAAGLAAALALTPLLRSQLYGVAPTDVLTYCAVALALGIVSLAACLLPAQRAAGVDPICVLRYE